MSESERPNDDGEATSHNLQTPPSKPKPWTARLPAWAYVLLGGMVSASAIGVAKYLPTIMRRGPGHGVGTRSFASATRSPWIDQGFVEMVPPLRLPGRPDGSEKIEVWVKFPPLGKLGATWIEAQGRYALTYPPGMIADRLEIMNGRNIVDVRGTDLGQAGEEVFHVYRPNGRGGLHGFTWKRGDEAAQQEATRVLLDWEVSNNPRERRSLEINNDCGGCHVHAREERRSGVPARAADAVGWYTPETILRDRAPVEKHRPKENNVDDKFIRFECPSATGGEVKPATFATRKNGTRWPGCPDELMPIGILDLPAALAAGDEHARGLCASRRAIFEHMDETGKKAFASSFEVCDIR